MAKSLINILLKTIRVKYILLAFLLIGNIIISTAIWHNQQKTKIGYIDLPVIYEKFKMKKELEARLSREMEASKSELSLFEEEIRNVSDPEVKEMKKKEYNNRKKEMLQASRAASGEYTNQVWKQLNHYIKEYRDQNNYAVIFGADGSGSMMAADTSLNITESVIAFANENYQGYIQRQ